jgi:DNA helicase HerA-like ATPase
MDEKVVAAARAAFGDETGRVSLGAVVHDGECTPQPIVGLPFAMLNRHGLVAGATGTGKTKSIQTMAEQLLAAGVPVFLADVKGDLTGVALPGEPSQRVQERAQQVGVAWQPNGCPVELLSLTGALGAQLRATVSSFGPLALAKVLGLNETQTSVLSLVFKYSDDHGLPLLDFPDLRAVLQHLSGPGASELADYGVVSKASVGVLLREMVQLEQQGGARLFGEPELDLADLLRVEPDGRGLVTVLELADVQDKPALWSTFMMWMLARLYYDLPEVGDLPKPKLVFFFDEAHLLFRDASRAFRSEVEQVVRLIRSKGVGVFFCSQNPTDLPPEILGQLGCRVQHALRAFTADDDKALRAAARTFPKTPFYDIPSTLTSLGTGEALVTVIAPSGAPTPPFATRVRPPTSRMGPVTEAERARLLDTSQVRKYATAIDRDSAREMLARRVEARAPAPAEERESPRRDDRPREPPAPRRRAETDTVGRVLNSPMARTVATQITRGIMGAIFGAPPRRRHSW